VHYFTQVIELFKILGEVIMFSTGQTKGFFAIFKCP